MKVIFGGSIGTGKSSIACIGISYVIYKLLCLKDPAEYYEVMKGLEFICTADTLKEAREEIKNEG